MAETKKFNIPASDVVNQVLLKLNYQTLVKENKALPNINDTGFRIFSQNDEDGILLFIFSILGTTNKQCVEIGCGNGLENNTTNLILNHSWHGLLVDGNLDNIDIAKQFFSGHPDSRTFPPYLNCSMVTPDNINDLIKSHELDKDIDLFSIDIDSIDYYVLDALKVIEPRVIIVETPTICGPDKAKVVPNDPKYNLMQNANFYGASLAAYNKLLTTKGYRLIGVSRYGTNAFFIKEELAIEHLPTKKVEECFFHPRAKKNIINRWELSKNEPWVDV